MRIGIDIGSTTVKVVLLDDQDTTIFHTYERHMSKVREKTAEMLAQLRPQLSGQMVQVAITGSAGLGVAKAADLEFVQEVFATAGAVERFIPDTDVVVELGGEDAKIIFLTGGLEERMNGSCAGGTGAFIDQMATLLGITADELDRLSLGYEKLYAIASRCGVFAKSDIQPLLNQGARKEDIAASIFQAVVNQTIAGLAQGRQIKGKVLFLGGPTANFRFPSCREQMLRGMCNGGKHCLAPTTCSHMIVDHSDYLKILRRVRELPGVKKVFIRSGIRFDYLMADPDDTFFKELVEYHVSGQLKVAPEHCAPNTLAYMGKPPIQTFNKFKDKFYELSKKAGKKQYLVPYLMSSHPGSTLSDAVYLAEYLYKNHMRPEQVQDFYPTPGTVSTCMFYTGLDPYTLKPVFVEKTAEGKALQRALLQYYEPRNAEKVIKALKMTHREDLIPLLVPAEGRRAVQRSARRAEAAEVTIHNDGTYTVRPNGKGKGRPQGHTAPANRSAGGRQPSPGARFAPRSAPGHKPKNDQQKENTTWKNTNRKK